MAGEQESDAERAEKNAELAKQVEQGVDLALRQVETRFEQPGDPEDRLDFHNTEHTRGVMERTQRVLEAIQKAAPDLVDEKTLALGRLAASFHDTVQNWEPGETEDGRLLRKRFVGDNERASAEEAVDFMKGVNEKGEDIFSDEDMQMVGRAIDATIPGFDPEKGTVSQPELSAESSPVARAVALADLGEAGMDPEAFLKTGNTWFREENLDIQRALESGAELSDDQKEDFRQRMLNWAKFQPKFAEGRRALLAENLEGLPDAAQAEVTKLFDKFDDSVRLATERAERREDMTFEELLEDMGY